MVNIIGEGGNDDKWKDALKVVIKKSTVKDDLVEFIDVESLVTRLVNSINLSELGISEEDLHNQMLEEIVFQYIFKVFGPEGWQIGMWSVLKKLQGYMDSYKARQEIPEVFLDFISSLNEETDDEHLSTNKRLVIVKYPILDRATIIHKPDDARLETFNENQQRNIKTFLEILVLAINTYPSRFNSSDNPDGNILVNVIDTSYLWFAARNSKYQDLLRRINQNSIYTPFAKKRDSQILGSFSQNE